MPLPAQLKLSETYEPFLPWFRESELRHGRTAMLAVVGFITTDFIRIPGEAYSFESIPKTIDAHDVLVGKGPMVQLLLWIGLFDLLITAPACAATMKGDREPGGEWICALYRVFVWCSVAVFEDWDTGFLSRWWQWPVLLCCN